MVFLYAVVPYLWNNREPGRFFFLVSFALAALAGFGMDNLFGSPGDGDYRALRPFLKWISIFCAVAIVVPGLFPQLPLGIWTCLSLLFISRGVLDCVASHLDSAIGLSVGFDRGVCSVRPHGLQLE